MTPPAPRVQSDGWRIANRVAYVVSHAQPWSSNGYAARTHAVARALGEAGHDVIVFTRPGRPWDIEGFDPSTDVPLDLTHDGVRYISLPMPPMPGASPFESIRAATDILAEALAVFRPAAVLAASNWQTAEPARRAAGRRGLPFFYEQRGFWAMGADPGSSAAEEEARIETEIALAARAVFTLNEPMRAELVRRGVPSGRVALVPNGISFRARGGARVSRDSIGSKARYLIGYIGSLSSYEGVEDIVHLTAQLRGGAPAPGLDVDALIVGDDSPKGLIGTAASPAQEALRRLAASLGIGAHVHILPQMPEDRAASHYALLDAMILPRRRTPVTELVPPIKPFAATAHGVPVYMTDLPPLAEIAAEIHGTTFPEGDIPGLAALVRTGLTEGHPAAVASLDPALDWSQRVRPISRHLDAVAEAERARTANILNGFGLAQRAPDEAEPRQAKGFDLTCLPHVALQHEGGAPYLALLGPGRTLELEAGVRLLRLTRTNILDTLATNPPGRFVIDWAGLQAEPEAEWAGLWSIEDMRLNRQIMDAVRIAMDQGWRPQVLGPVHRSQAPLFRTVAGVVEEVPPPGGAVPATRPQRETAA